MQGARRRAAQRALGEHAGEVALVVDRAAAVGARRAVRRGDLARLREQLLRRRLAAQQLLGPGEVDRRQPDGAERDADVGDRRRRRSRRPPTPRRSPSRRRAARPSRARCRRPGAPASRISVSISPAPTAVMYGPTWKSSIPTTRSPLGAADHDLRLGRGADGRQVLGGVGLAERAADRAAVAHDRVGDHVSRRRGRAGSARPAGRTSAGRRAGSARRSGSRRPARGCRRARRGR